MHRHGLLLSTIAVAVLVVAWMWFRDPPGREATREATEGEAPTVESQPPTTQAPETTRERVELAEGTPASAAESREPEFATLVVHVRDPKSAPMPDWLVVVEPSAGETAAGAAVLLRTDARGTAERPLPSGEYALHPLGKQGPERILVALAPGQRRDVELRVGEAFALRGVVLEPARQPVPFARLLLRFGTNWDSAPIEIGRADAAGTFQLQMPAAALGTISATADGYRASEELLLSPKRPEIELVLGLTPARLLLLVTRADGAPAAGCGVEVGTGNGWIRTDVPFPRMEGTRRIGACDRDGRILLADLWPGSAAMTLRDPAHAVHFERIVVSGGTETLHRVQLQAGASLAGTVRDDTGAPVAEATIGAGSLVTTRSAGDGSYRLSSLSPTASEIRVSHREYLDAVDQVALTAGQQATWDPVLRRAPQIRGRLVDGSGAPLPQHLVLAHFSNRAEGSVGGAAATDAQGRFELRTRKHAAFTLFVTEARDGLKPFLVPLGGEHVHPGADEVLLRIAPERAATASFHGRVELPTAVDVASIKLDVMQHLPTGGVGGAPAIAPSTSGFFEHGPLPPGEYSLTLHATQPRIARTELARFRLSPQERRDLGSLSISALGTLRIRATGRDGPRTEPPSIQLEPLDGGMQQNLGRCDAAGLLTVRLSPGRYRVSLFGSDFFWPVRELTIAANQHHDVSFELEPAVRRQLHFVLPPEEDACTFEIVRSDGAPVTTQRITRETGGVSRLMPFFSLGRYEVRATGASGKRYAQSFTVTSLEHDASGIRIEPK